MSKRNASSVVFKKEFMEMLRDKRVRTGALIMPIFLVFVFVSMFGFIFSSIEKPQSVTIHVVKTDDQLVSDLKKEGLKVEYVNDIKAGESLIKSGKARLVASFGPPPTLERPQQVIELRFDPKEQMGDIAKARFFQSLKAAMTTRAEAAVVAAGLPKEAAEPLKFKEVPVKVGQGESANQMVVGLLPYFMVLFAFLGGFSIASDLVAGEKEKSTLETLLITPVSRTQIVLGKFFALGAISMLSSLSGLLGLALTVLIKPAGTSKMFESGLGLNPTSALIILVLLLPLVAFFSSLLVAVSTYARNMREAQTYLGLVNLVVVVPAVFSQVIGLTDFAHQFWINYIPILNTANNIRATLLGKPDMAGIGATVVVGIVLAAISLFIAIRLFNQEKVLMRV